MIDQGKREKTQVSNIRNKIGDITIPSPDNGRLRENYEHLYANKSNNLGELGKFLEEHILLKFIQG